MEPYVNLDVDVDVYEMTTDNLKERVGQLRALQTQVDSSLTETVSELQVRVDQIGSIIRND